MHGSEATCGDQILETFLYSPSELCKVTYKQDHFIIHYFINLQRGKTKERIILTYPWQRSR